MIGVAFLPDTPDIWAWTPIKADILAYRLLGGIMEKNKVDLEHAKTISSNDQHIMWNEYVHWVSSGKAPQAHNT